MTEIHYDCEFLECGSRHPIDFISIGMRAETGDELYLISSEFDRRAVGRHEWLMANVVPSLPFTAYPSSAAPGMWLVPDVHHADYPALMPRSAIAAKVRDFVLSFARPSLWGWYCAYDHVVLCQLFGTMAELPEGFPAYTHDLKHEADRLGNPRLPRMPGAVAHRSIDDARETWYRHRWLRTPGEAATAP